MYIVLFLTLVSEITLAACFQETFLIYSDCSYHGNSAENFYQKEDSFRGEDFIRLKTNLLNFLEKTLFGKMDEQFGEEIKAGSTY